MILRLRLRTQLALLYAILFASLLGIAGFGVYRLMSLRLRADADDNLVDHMAGLWGYIRFTNAKPEIKYDPNNQYQAYFLREATRYYQLYDARTGELLLESDDSALLHMSLRPAEALTLQSHTGIDTVYSQPVPVRFRSALFHVETRPYLLRVGVTVEHDLADLEQLRSVLLRLFPLTTLLAILVAWWMAGRALRPVRDLQREANRISITRLDLRLRRNGTGDELDALAGTFNEVIARLDSGVQQMRNFAGYMAHELRTPMTVLRGETEVELMQPDLPPKWRLHLENHLEQFDKLQRLINRFLLLAKAETGALKLTSRSFELSAMIAFVAGEFQPLVESAGVSLQLAMEEGVSVVGDQEWMERALLNLLDNALKFTSEGGEIRVSVKRSGSSAIVEVKDTGRGIGAEDIPHIFEYFYRGAESATRPNTTGGLGLALTKWIVEQHAGTIDVKSKLEEGSTFTIVLPSTPEPTAR